MKFSTQNVAAFFLAIAFCCTGNKCYSTAWTTASAGAINTLSNWTNGSTSPTSFTTPGDTWTVDKSMTITSSGTWTVGTISSTAVTVTFIAGGTLNASGSGSSIANVTIYGNVVNSGGTISRSGSGSTGIAVNIYGNYSMTSGDIDASGSGSGTIVMNVHGNFTQSGGDIHRGGSGTTADTINVHGNYSMTGGTVSSGGSGFGNVNINVYGNFSVSGTSAMTYSAAGSGNVVRLRLNTGAGTMMIDNTSTGSWSGTNVYIDTNCTAQLAGNFSTTTGSATFGLTVDGTLICPATYTVNGTRKFILNGLATLKVAHTTGINGAIVTTGTKTFSNSANYEFNGTAAQVTGADMPASLVAPDTITINNPMGVTLSQTTSTTGKLMLTSGILHTGTYTMTVPGGGASVSGAGLASYIEGTFIKTAAGNGTLFFEVGDTSYAPMLLIFDATATAGSVGMKVNNGLHPNIATSGITASFITTHYWTVTNFSLAGPDTVYPKAEYNLSTIVSGSNNYFRTQKYSGSAWLSSARVSTNTSAPYTTTTDTGFALASFAGDYIFGRINMPSLGANSVAKVAGINISPNPSKGVFTLLAIAATEEDLQLTVTDIFGRIVSEFVASTNKTINVKLDVVAGVYLLSAKSKSETYSGRIVID